MKIVTTGVNSQGRSCVVSVEERNEMGRIWSSPTLPPELGYVRPKTASAETKGFTHPVAAVCQFIRFQPNSVGATHRLDSYSVVTLTKGGTTMTLEDGSVYVAGDVLIMPAIVHGWKTGSSGCEFTVMMFNVGPP